MINDFKVTPLYDAEYLRNGTRCTDIVSMEYNYGLTNALLSSVISNDLSDLE